MKRTPEEIKAWYEKMGTVAKAIRAMDAKEREDFAARMPIVTAEGHPLSIFNQCFLASQGFAGTLSMVGGFRQWGKAARHVRKGEHACGFIYVPIGKPQDDDPNRQEGETSSKNKAPRFRLIPVFDVMQTDEGGTYARNESPETAEVA